MSNWTTALDLFFERRSSEKLRLAAQRETNESLLTPWLGEIYVPSLTELQDYLSDKDGCRCAWDRNQFTIYHYDREVFVIWVESSALTLRIRQYGTPTTAKIFTVGHISRVPRHVLDNHIMVRLYAALENHAKYVMERVC